MKNCFTLLLAAVCISLATPSLAADAPKAPPQAPAPTPSTGNIGGGVTNPWRNPRTAHTDSLAQNARFMF